MFTPARFEGLPGLPVQCDEGRYVTKDQISEYLEGYAERFGVPVRLGIEVRGLCLDEHGQILVEWDHGRLIADQVIVAADLYADQRNGDPRIILLRAGDYRTLSQLSQPGGVVVLAAGSTHLSSELSPCELAARAAHFRRR